MLEKLGGKRLPSNCEFRCVNVLSLVRPMEKGTSLRAAALRDVPCLVVVL
jgi:hypothetical protein